MPYLKEYKTLIVINNIQICACIKNDLTISKIFRARNERWNNNRIMKKFKHGWTTTNKTFWLNNWISYIKESLISNKSLQRDCIYIDNYNSKYFDNKVDSITIRTARFATESQKIIILNNRYQYGGQYGRSRNNWRELWNIKADTNYQVWFLTITWLFPIWPLGLWILL